MKHEKQEQLRRVSRFPICVFEKREEMQSPAAEILVGKLFCGILFADETFFARQTFYLQDTKGGLSMKYRGCLFLCALLLLSGCLCFSGCSAAPQRQETPMTAPSPAWPETTEAMKDFLSAHQAEMEEIVAVMMEYSSRETENEYTTFWYSVKWQKLHQSHTVIEKDVHGPGPQEMGVFTEHPIITKIRALGEEPGFDFAAADFSHRIVDNDICYFSGCVDDDAGSPYTDVYLFYCEEEPVEQEYFYIYPVIPHWYLYIEYLE